MKKGPAHEGPFSFFIFHLPAGKFFIFNFLLDSSKKKSRHRAGLYKQLVWNYAILKPSRNLVLKLPLMNCSLRISC